MSIAGSRAVIGLDKTVNNQWYLRIQLAQYVEESYPQKPLEIQRLIPSCRFLLVVSVLGGSGIKDIFNALNIRPTQVRVGLLRTWKILRDCIRLY